MGFQERQKLLNERYVLIQKQPPAISEQPYETWTGVRLDTSSLYLIKLWPFLSNEESVGIQQALWDHELRLMYRVASSPGADASILTLKEAGIDHGMRCFVMVLESHGSREMGFTTLEQAIGNRGRNSWLRNLDAMGRMELWRGLARIADGIQLLHDQLVIHRDVSLANISIEEEVGPSSFRLGGFEWSVRLGEARYGKPPLDWCSPPEHADREEVIHQPETDWYGFGMVILRCMVSVEDLRNNPLRERHTEASRRLQEATLAGRIGDTERQLIARLLESERIDRLACGYEIKTAIEDIISSLGRVGIPEDSRDELIVAYLPDRSHGIAERAREAGVTFGDREEGEEFNSSSGLHCAQLCDFIASDLVEPVLYATNYENSYVLVGRQLTLTVQPYNAYDPLINERRQTWEAAFCTYSPGLQWGVGGTASTRSLVDVRIKVLKLQELGRNKRLLSTARSWESFLPYFDESDKLRADLDRFHQFIRCTNQIELLMRDSELFRYEVVSRDIEGLNEVIVVREIARERPPIRFFVPDNGMCGFLRRELSSGKENCDLAVLLPENQGSLRPMLDRRIEPTECFAIREFGTDDRTVKLYRSTLQAKSAPVPDNGWLRTYGMFGQIRLLQRRTDAVGRLEKHAYLLRTLATAGNTYMDTGITELPSLLNDKQVDQQKEFVMQDIMRTRPIYCLQGPPGTGKTTMVAHLLRQVFEDDPVAQIVITAQAHGAVDVLREKVVNEAFADVPDPDKPLSVRLGVRGTGAGLRPGSVSEVGLAILEGAQTALSAREGLSAIQREWLDYVKEQKTAIQTSSFNKELPEFLELVKRGANITYCTTSAGDLEELASNSQSFDWAIIEEAGKCHGFDLALPLQAAHRWVLIGDQNQLQPYRYRDYQVGLENLGEVVHALKGLPYRGAGLVDTDWISNWDSEGLDQEQFKKYALKRLKTFDFLWRNCAGAPPGAEMMTRGVLTQDASCGAIAGMLSGQYRMHPTIGTLISKAFYADRGGLTNMTLDDDGEPKAGVVLNIRTPAELNGRAIVWIDTLAAWRDPRAAEIGPEQRRPRYTNPTEIEAILKFLAKLEVNTAPGEKLTIAVLAPYSMQVREIRRRIIARDLPEGIEPKRELSANPSAGSSEGGRIGQTVDSFQGNQADIVIVSMVRNSDSPLTRTAIGFLEESERLNVLLSRAQRLLVLVGSFEFFQRQAALLGKDHHLNIVVGLLEQWFEEGLALRLDISDL